MSNEAQPAERHVSAREFRFGVVAARFNASVVERLVQGAIDALLQHEAWRENITVYRVPGAFEIPLAVKRLAATGRYDGLVALGAVIRGATPHFDFVAGECASGLARVMLETNLPVGFGVLTVDTLEQALERAGDGPGNKGADAALAVLEMIELLRQIDA